MAETARYLARPVDDLCESELWPLKPKWVKAQLHHGKFLGLGIRHGRRWLLTDDDSEQIRDRMHVKPEVLAHAHPSGLSDRSLTLRKIERAPHSG
ncbi:hypothetical protein [Gordonia oryzae]|uniref:hypothetical protein n=1 Tax=Gordonia oryzae TaxID=2487349 RepID=UPI000F50599A|nr:hypothetical protein [Gordonia oryzae]